MSARIVITFLMLLVVSSNRVTFVSDCTDATLGLVPLSELTVNYGSFKVIAREMRGGAMIFLTPINTITPTN